MPPSLLFCPNMILSVFGAVPSGSVVNNPPANAEEVGSIPESGRFPEEGSGNPLQYSCLGNHMDRGAWWVPVHGITKSQT